MTLVNHFPPSTANLWQPCPVSRAISHLPLLGVVALGLPRVQQGLDFAAGCARAPSGSGAALGFSSAEPCRGGVCAPQHSSLLGG